jgi:hypothetical protein
VDRADAVSGGLQADLPDRLAIMLGPGLRIDPGRCDRYLLREERPPPWEDLLERHTELSASEATQNEISRHGPYLRFPRLQHARITLYIRRETLVLNVDH